jgi:Fe(3+) dicitrate transport protein
VGVIPSYRIYDWSAHVDLWHDYQLQIGVDNVMNARYFTLRAVEYPGPGIIPSAGPTAYATIRATVR